MTWSKNGTTTLSSAGDTVTVSSLTASDFNHFMMHGLWTGTTLFPEIRVGNGSVDTGSNYAYRSQADGAADTTGTSQTSLPQIRSGADLDNLSVGYFINIETEEKLFIYHTAQTETSGAGTAPTRREIVGKWVNTSNQIDTIQSWDNGGTSTFASDSNLTVLNGDTTEETILGNNVQSGSRFEATDTRKIYYGVLPSVTFEEEYTSNTGWTQVGTLVTVNSGYSGAVGSINAGSMSDQRVYKSLGITLDTDWVMNFEYQTPSGYANSVSAFPIYVSAGNEHAEDTGDKIGVFRDFYNVGGVAHSMMVPFFKDGSNSRVNSATSIGIDMGAYTNPNSGTWYYFTLTKSGNTLTLKAFTDSARTSQFGNTATLSDSNLANISGLSYLQHSPIKSGGWANGDYWTIDNVDIYNGVSSTDFTWTEEA